MSFLDILHVLSIFGRDYACSSQNNLSTNKENCIVSGFFADPDPDQGKNLHADPDPDPGGIRGRGLGVKGKKFFTRFR